MDALQDPLGDRARAGARILAERAEAAAGELLVAVGIAPAQLVHRHAAQLVEPRHQAILGFWDSMRFLKFVSRPGNDCSASMRSTIEGTSAPSFRSIL